MADIPDHEKAREGARKLIDKLGIAPTLSYLGKRTEDEWEHDAWDVVMGTYRTTYKTGLGHRVWAKPHDVRAVLPFGYKPHKYSLKDLGTANTIHRERMEQRHLKPIVPDYVDVVCSLVRDGDAVNYSFLDWCAEYGYSSDSIKARSMYDTCCDIGQRMRQQIKRGDLEKLQEFAHEL